MDEQPTSDAIAEVEPVVRRVLAARVPAVDVDDLVQTTLARLLASPQARTADDLEAYAAIAARNAAASHYRATARRRDRSEPVIDLTADESADQRALRSEEEHGVRAALSGLSTDERRLVEAHHVDGDDLRGLARMTGRSEMAVRLTLARARAKLRVDYVLAFNNVSLPTDGCRPVLLALSSGDRRSQQRLGTDAHLAACPACAELVVPATGKRRPAVGALPLLALWWTGLSQAGRRAISFGGASIAVAAVAVAIASARPTPHPEQASTPTTTSVAAPATVPARQPGRVRVDDQPLGATPAALRSAVGRPVTANAAAVLDVPTDEGFWIASDDGGRLWVQLVGPAGESPVTVTTGVQVSFEGTVVGHDSAFADAVGLAAGSSADALTEAGHHLEVAYTALKPG